MFGMYVDESGDPGRPLDQDRNVIHGSSKLFTLAGIIVDGKEKDRIDANVRDLALSFFSESVVNTTKIHCHPLLRRAPPYDALSSLDRHRLEYGMFRIIQDSPCTLLSVTIDLVAHFDKYSFPINPKAYAMLIILERFQSFLEDKNARGIVKYERFNKIERKKLRGTMNRLRQMLALKHYVEIDNIQGDIQNGNPLKDPVLQLADFFAYATQEMYRTNGDRSRRWDSIREKYHNIDSGYYESGCVYR